MYHETQPYFYTIGEVTICIVSADNILIFMTI